MIFWYQKSRGEKSEGALCDIILTIISWSLVNLNPNKLIVNFKFLSGLLMGFHSGKQFTAFKCIIGKKMLKKNNK